MTRERFASLANKYTSKCSVGIVFGERWCSVFTYSVIICVTMVALRNNSFCQTNVGTKGNRLSVALL